MFKRFTFALVLSFGYGSILFAYNHPCPNHGQLSLDYLYFLPSVDDTYFAIKSSTTSTFPMGKGENNDFGFHSGFRVGAEYAFCDPQRELQLFYTYLDADQQRTVSGNYLWGILGRADFAANFENYQGAASSRLGVCYQRGEAIFSQHVLDSAGLFFYLEPGVECVFMRLHERYQYTETTDGDVGVIHQASTAWGIGPQMGFELGYSFYKTKIPPSTSQKKPPSIIHDLSINAFFAGSILAARSRAKAKDELNNADSLDVDVMLTWRVLPALHSRVGLDYFVHGKRLGFSLGAGYEFNTYIRAISRLIFPDDLADALSFSNYYNLDVQGLYVSASLSF